MYTTYTGEQVRIRPVASEAEWARITSSSLEDPPGLWGPWHGASAMQVQRFAANGGLDLEQGLTWAIEELAGNSMAGYLNLHSDLLSYWTGTHLFGAWRRRGFGSEAKRLAACFLFENLPLDTLYAVTLEGHTAAIRGLERCGMRYIGLKPAAHFSCGRHVAKLFYAISRRDWLSMDYRHVVARS